MSEFFDEAEADAAVAAVLAKHKISSKEGQVMQLIKTEEGIKRVINAEAVSQEYLEQRVTVLKEKLARAENNLKAYKELVEPAPQATVAAPSAPQPETPQQPTPQPVVVTEPAPQPQVNNGTAPTPVVVQ